MIADLGILKLQSNASQQRCQTYVAIATRHAAVFACNYCATADLYTLTVHY
jgi:hypothetical protein